MRGLWLLLLATAWALVEEEDELDASDGAICEDRDDRWAAHGTTCEKMKRLCNADGYRELVQSWCPVSCGLCVPTEVKEEQDEVKKSSRPNAGQWSFDDAADDRNSSWNRSNSSWNRSNVNATMGQEDGPVQAQAELARAVPQNAEPLGAGANLSNHSCQDGNCSMASSDGGAGSSLAEPENSSANASAANSSTEPHRAPSRPLLDGKPSVGRLLEGSLGTPPVKSALTLPRASQENRTSLNFSGNISHGKALLMLEELDEAAENGTSSAPFDLADFKFKIVGGTGLVGFNGTAALDLDVNFTLPEDAAPRLSDGLEERQKEKSAEVELEEKEKTCPEGWERVIGDVYGGDQFTGNWKHSAASMEDCAWSCLRQSGCGSFEYSPSKKRCYRNSQTKPTHKQDRHDFVFCRRRPCPSLKTKEACVGPGIASGHYSKEVKLRPGSYCIWSGGYCQAPLSCTDSDCFLPDGGLPGMDLPSHQTLWISKAGLQASMGRIR